MSCKLWHRNSQRTSGLCLDGNGNMYVIEMSTPRRMLMPGQFGASRVIKLVDNNGDGKMDESRICGWTFTQNDLLDDQS